MKAEHLEYKALWLPALKADPETFRDFVTELNKSPYAVRELRRFEDGLRVCLLLKSKAPCTVEDLEKNTLIENYYGANDGRFTFDGKRYFRIAGLAIERETSAILLDLQAVPVS